eukprot:1134882-Pelagomonas_calceolata.AAC.1
MKESLWAEAAWWYPGAYSFGRCKGHKIVTNTNNLFIDIMRKCNKTWDNTHIHTPTLSKACKPHAHMHTCGAIARRQIWRGKGVAALRAHGKLVKPLLE